jgi:uncharacterized membrane protein YkvA (DUF1232 family)
MTGWLRAVLLAVALMVGTWVFLVLLARRLPPGLLRELSSFVPDCVTTIRRLRGDPRVPRRAKVAVALAGLWLLSPIDLLPEFLPVIGPLDDVVVVALALRYAARQVPRQILAAAWPGEPRLLERLLGSPDRRGLLGHPLAPGDEIDQHGQKGRNTSNSTHRVFIPPEVQPGAGAHDSGRGCDQEQ